MLRLRAQRGVFLIEAMIGLIIFSIGIIAMIRLQASAIAIQADSQYRMEAGHLVDRLISEISLNVNGMDTNAADGIDNTQPTQAGRIVAAIAPYQHQPNVGLNDPPNVGCSFAGNAAADPGNIVANWVADVQAQLPGSNADMQQVLVTTTPFVINGANYSYTSVTVTVCWQAPGDALPRRHSVMAYINN